MTKELLKRQYTDIRNFFPKYLCLEISYIFYTFEIDYQKMVLSEDIIIEKKNVC